MAAGRIGPFTALLVAALTLLALGVRLYDLDRRTLTHPEVFAPGIALPAYVVEPSPRLTIQDVLHGSLTGDIHPPAFYLIELGWTSAFGTKLFAIRLPSVLFGTFAVLLVFVFGRREMGIAAALFAAALLALHGEHVFWSQHARMWTLLSFLAIASALLLAKLREEGGRSIAVLYAAVTAVGLWTEYYFWPLFLAEVLWIAAHALGNRRAVIGLDAQTLAAVLASPVLIYFHYQRQRGNFLPADLREPLLGMLPLAKVSHLPALTSLNAGLWLALSVALIVIAGLAIAIGVVARGTNERRADATFGNVEATAAPTSYLLVAALVVSTFVAVIFPPVASPLTIGIAVLAPWVLSVTWLVIRRWLTKWAAGVGPRRVSVLLRPIAGDLTLTLLAVPLLILGAIHIVKEPVLVERGLVILAPFVVLMIARGVLVVRRSAARAGVVVLLLALSAASTYESLSRRNSPRDYQGLTEQLRSQILAGDVVVVENRWWATPVHYYLPPDRFRLIPPAAVSPPLPPRVWVVMFGPRGLERAARFAAASLPGYEQRTRVSALEAHAALFESIDPQ